MKMQKKSVHIHHNIDLYNMNYIDITYFSAGQLGHRIIMQYAKFYFGNTNCVFQSQITNMQMKFAIYYTVKLLLYDPPLSKFSII